jgi:hypothetical protein
MKIFIDNYKPIQLLTILHNLETYFHSKETLVEVYTDSGIFLVNNNCFKELHITDEKIHETIKLQDFRLIIDKSKVLLKDNHHLPNNHISIYLTSMKYCLHNSSRQTQTMTTNTNKVFLVIEGPTPNKPELIENNFSHFIPNNFYFEIDEDKFTLEECKNDLIVFLSLLK